MRIHEVTPEPNWLLRILAEDGRSGAFDVKPFLYLPKGSRNRGIGESWPEHARMLFQRIIQTSAYFPR